MRILFSFLLLIIIILLSFLIGPIWIRPDKILADPIFWQIRMPRVLLAALVGMMLSVSGAVLQGALKNPLADPYILGVSAGAAVGAALAISLKLAFSVFGISSIPFMAFIFSIAMVFLVYWLAKNKEGINPQILILSGVAVSAFASAVLALIIIISGQIQSIYFWMLGSFSMASMNDVFTLLPYYLAGLFFAYFYSKELNVLMLGDDLAGTMGVDVLKTRMFLIVIATLMTSAAVSVSGLIGFVGLIIPHFVRMFCGQNYRLILIYSALCGALLMLVADALARTVLSPMEIPIGIIMALIGAPFFLYILRRNKR
ncbi:MAG: iron complex transport system permease protein [Candidatus Saganbacteria bacterium]|uniref:Iron complex transport system permease protein n=1 Tax=Candidatus Saganbacteria bacterium TaxID=2575572 RepID=A0A833NWI3_UNCSA|nr:MAG: iron complex transport system permease protein [Candidatus Saganbacteria bacterium]